MGEKTKVTRWEGNKEEEEGDVSVAFHSKKHGSQEVGMQHRSKTDSRLKVYWLPEFGREKGQYERNKQIQFYYIHLMSQNPKGKKTMCCASLKRCSHVHLTFKTSGVEFDKELGSARCFHYGLDALKLDVGLLWRLRQTWRGRKEWV